MLLPHTALESRANQLAELTRQVLLKLCLQGRTKKTKGFGAHKGKVKKSILNCADAQLEIGMALMSLGNSSHWASFVLISGIVQLHREVSFPCDVAAPSRAPFQVSRVSLLIANSSSKVPPEMSLV